MDVTDILDPLNDEQRAAVAAPPGHLLVLAGAGSGKTRVLVHRIAWLLATREATPFGILAVTFTNKAASEMRTRIESLLGRPVGGMWVGTFHGLAHRLLRAHWRDAGLAEGFQILDSDDQVRCVRRVLRDLDLDEQRWPVRQAQGFINARKDEGLRAEHLDQTGDAWMERMQRIYATYQETCERSGVVDFAELLLRCHELLRDREDVLAHYRARFGQILVDEFQDTNTIQYAWLRLLAGGTGHLYCVGDDDQSVYGWRGARIENILQFPRDFTGVETVRLERNYRSSGNILAAANALIANNQGRMGKNLWTEDADGDPDCGLRGVQRHRRGPFRRRAHPAMGRRRGAFRREVAVPVPGERPVAGAGRSAPCARNRLPGIRRSALLRACGDQKRARVLSARGESRRRRRLRTNRQRAAQGYRRAYDRCPANRSEAPERVSLGPRRSGSSTRLW